jgi:type III secretion protein Q
MTGLSPAGGVGPEPAAPAPGRRIPVARLDQIELPLELTLPAPTLSLVELAALAPGDVVTLPLSTADASVRLSVNGQTLGLGELVAVGSQLGVRIVRLAGAFGAPPDAIAGEAP